MNKINDSKRLTRLRELLGYSQRDLADEFQVSHAAVGLWESGKRAVPGPVQKLMDLYEKQLGVEASQQEVIETIQSSWLSRSLRLSHLGTEMTAKLFLHAFFKIFQSGDTENSIRAKTYQALGGRMVDTLGKMKGLPLKLGQIISYMDMEVPQDIRDHFRTLQQSTPPLSESQIIDIFLQDFKKLPKEMFEKWNPMAFSAASMGQVHQAQLASGEKLAVKVQYPGLEKIIQNDLKHVDLLEKIGSLVLKGHQTGQVMDELKERFIEECDYIKERKNLDRFKKLYKDHEKIRIPKTYADLSSKHILTMEFLDGQTYSEFIQSASQKQKEQAAKTIWDFVWTSIFKHQLFSADPHPGNYVFMKNNQVGFLDFGCVKDLSDDFFKTWKNFLKALFSDNKAVMFKELNTLGIFSDIEKIDQDHFYTLMRAWYEPAYSGKTFHFNRDFVQSNWKKMTVNNPNMMLMTFPKELVFLNQVQWGLYALLGDMDVKGNWNLTEFLL